MSSAIPPILNLADEEHFFVLSGQGTLRVVVPDVLGYPDSGKTGGAGTSVVVAVPSTAQSASLRPEVRKRNLGVLVFATRSLSPVVEVAVDAAAGARAVAVLQWKLPRRVRGQQAQTLQGPGRRASVTRRDDFDTAIPEAWLRVTAIHGVHRRSLCRAHGRRLAVGSLRPCRAGPSANDPGGRPAAGAA